MISKIAIFTPLSSNDRGGAQAYIKDFISYVNYDNSQEILLISSDKGEYSKGCIKSKLICSICSSFSINNPLIRYFFSFLIYLQIIHLKYKYKIEYIYSIGIYPILLVYKNFSYFLPKLTIRPYGYDIQKNQKHNYGIRLNEKINFIYNQELKKHKYISISEDVSRELKNFEINDRKILNSGNSINIKKFSKFKFNELELIKRRKEYLKNNKLPLNSTICLTVSTNVPKKRLYQIPKIAEFYASKKEYNHKHFILLGKNLKSKFKDNNYGNSSLKIYDAKDNDDLNIRDLTFFYNISDLFLLTSSIETFGRVIIESIFFKCLPISYNIKGVNKILPINYKLISKKDNLKNFIQVINKAELILNDKDHKRILFDSLKNIPLQYDHEEIIKEHIKFIISNY